MALRAIEHSFTGATTPIASYDFTKTNLGSLMVQKSGVNPEDNFVGPLPVAVARPMEESTPVAMMFPHAITYSSTIDWVFMVENTVAAAKRIFLYEYNKTTANYNWKGYITATTQNATSPIRGFRALRYLHTTGTVGVSTPTSFYSAGTSVALAATGVVTGVGTTFTIGMVGMMIGFGSTNPALINCWYPIISFTNTTTITVSGASSAIAASANYVIATCTVTGVGTNFLTELIAAGTNVTGVAGGFGPRIGFGSNDPTQITQWFQIGFITDGTHLNLTTSPGVIAAGTTFVIEELRFAIVTTNTTTANLGGLYLVKGVGYLDFQTSSTAGPLVLPAIASAVDNQRGVYWLCDAGAGAVTNTTANGCAVEAETSKTSHFLYVLDGTNTSNAKFYKYNLRANNTVASGKMQLAGANIVITSTQAVTGTIPNAQVNNLTLATLGHGPGSGLPYLYFVTTTRLYCALASGIVGASNSFINSADARQEIPPGGVITFPATGNMANIQYIDSIDRLIITTSGAAGAAYRHYVTRYPSTDGTPFDHIFGIDDKQQDQSFLSSQGAIHFNSSSQLISLDANNGIVHICRNGTTAALNQIYALPFGAHWTYAYTTSPANHQRVITPSLSTSDCVKFDQVLVLDNDYLGSGELRISPESFRIYYRTTNITADATSSWTLLGDDMDLSSATAASAIQFMLEFFTIGNTCIPARIMKIIVTYEDSLTDSHFQMSTALSNIATKRFVWRFCCMFGGTVPTLKIQLFNADTGAALLTDTTVASAYGTWEKSTNGGGSWTAYNTTDKGNETTYISYTPSALSDSIMVRALLTQN